VAARHIALAVAGVLVTGMCVYLFLEVRASPAALQPRVASKDEPAPLPLSGDVEDEPDRDNEKPKTDASLRSGRVSESMLNNAESATPRPSDEPVVEGKLEGPKLDAVMAEANKAYDKMDFEEARSIAQKVLKVQPTNVRMLRVMTSSHCIEVDAVEAQKWFNLLPAPDREQIKTRCSRYGVSFTDPPAK